MDKSFIQGESKDKINSLIHDDVMLMPVAFLYEVVKHPNDKRAKIFSKFKSNSYKLSPSVEELFRYELKEHLPCGKPSSHTVPRDYSLHQILADPSYDLSDAQKQKVLDMKKFYDEYVKCVMNLRMQYQSLLKNSSENDIQDMILNDDSHILEKYRNIILDSKRFPNVTKPTSVDKDWAHYIWCQIMSLLSLDIATRYQENVIENSKVKEKVTHDLLDLEYLLISVLEGTKLYTNDKKLNKWRSLFG